jgi:hypothetical protein
MSSLNICEQISGSFKWWCERVSLPEDKFLVPDWGTSRLWHRIVLTARQPMYNVHTIILCHDCSMVLGKVIKNLRFSSFSEQYWFPYEGKAKSVL